jgi:dienelactone hydrolase
MPAVSKYFKKFYTSERALERHFKERALTGRFRGSGRAAAVAWQKKSRAKLSESLGLQHFKACPPAAKKVRGIKLDGLTREEWLFQSERDVWVPFYLFVPDDRKVKTPLVLCPHGHGSAGKWSPGGRHDIAEMPEVIARYNYDYGVTIARLGFITACPDARGFGERREPGRQNDLADPGLLTTQSCHELTLAGAPLGLTVQGMWTWDLMALVNLLSRDARIDAKRVACAGLSGGGLQTLNLAAIDTRIKAAVVSGYFYGVRESLQVKNGNCMCNLVPGLWEHFDMGDIGALIAPRALLVESGDADSLNGRSNLANVRSQISVTRKIYAQLSAVDRFEHAVFKGQHRWDGTRALPWLVEHV